MGHLTNQISLHEYLGASVAFITNTRVTHETPLSRNNRIDAGRKRPRRLTGGVCLVLHRKTVRRLL